MSKTYEVQGPDGFTYEVTMPDNADEGAIVERVQAFAKAENQHAAPTDPAAPDGPTGPGTFLENASATAGQFMGGMIPGSRKFLAGAGGVVGNGIAAAIGRDDFGPTEAYASGAASSDIDHARLEAEHPQAATTATLAGLAGSFAFPAARLARGGSLGARMLNGAATGAGYGALSSLLNDTGGGQLENAAMGAGFGGALAVTTNGRPRGTRSRQGLIVMLNCKGAGSLGSHDACRQRRSNLGLTPLLSIPTWRGCHADGLVKRNVLVGRATKQRLLNSLRLAAG